MGFCSALNLHHRKRFCRYSRAVGFNADIRVGQVKRCVYIHSYLLGDRVWAVPDTSIDELVVWLFVRAQNQDSEGTGPSRPYIKKRRNRLPSKIGRMSRRHGPSGANVNLR
jgi:hypothetical protein